MENIKNLTQDDLMDVEGGIDGWFDDLQISILSGMIAKPVIIDVIKPPLMGVAPRMTDII